MTPFGGWPAQPAGVLAQAPSTAALRGPDALALAGRAQAIY